MLTLFIQGSGNLDKVTFIYHKLLMLTMLTLFIQGSGNLDAIQIIKKLGGSLHDSYLDEG